MPITRKHDITIVAVEADDHGNVTLTTSDLRTSRITTHLTPDEADRLATELQDAATEAHTYQEELRA